MWQFKLSTNVSNLFENSGIKVLKKNHTNEYVYSQNSHLEYSDEVIPQVILEDCRACGILFWLSLVVTKSVADEVYF